MSYRSDGRDNGMVYLNEATKLLKRAVQCDRAGDCAAAMQCYQDAKSKFELASLQAALAQNLKDLSLERIAQCEKRMEELGGK